MRFFATLLALLLVGLAFTAPPAAAQIDVPPTPGALNTAVNANTTPGQVFRLQAGETYLLSDRIEPTVDVVVEADGGDCPTVEADCPLIQPIDPGGGPERVLQIETAGVSATLRQVAVTNTSPNETSDERAVRLQADGASVTLDRILGFGEPTMFIRVDNSAPDIYIYDSVFRDIGDPEGNPDEGRVVDDRGNDIGDLVLTGNTFYSVNNRVVRDDGGEVGFFRFEHNTVHLVGRRVVELDEGPVTGDVVIQNNLLVDTGIEGSEDDGDPDTDDRDAQIRIDEVGGDVTITNNSFVFDESLLLDPGTRPIGPKLYNEEAGDAAENTFSFRPAFTDPQPAFFDFSGVPHDYGYPESEPAFTAATNGDPLGALIWFGLTVDAEDGADALAFRLEGAAPNPATSAATLRFALDAPADVRLEVFDVLGRRVAVAADGAHAAGPHAAPLDVSALPAGLYVVRLTADGQTQTARMTVVR